MHMSREEKPGPKPPCASSRATACVAAWRNLRHEKNIKTLEKYYDERYESKQNRYRPGRRPTTDARRPTPDARRPTPDARRPTTDDRRPTTDDCLLFAGPHLPSTLEANRGLRVKALRASGLGLAFPGFRQTTYNTRGSYLCAFHVQKKLPLNIKEVLYCSRPKAMFQLFWGSGRGLVGSGVR